MKSLFRAVLLLCLTHPLSVYAQGRIYKKEISGQIQSGDTGQWDSNSVQKYPLLNFNSYFILLGQNLKRELTKPFHLSKKDWGNFGKYAAVTMALSFVDEPVQQTALRWRNRNTGWNAISKEVTNFGGIYEVFTLGGIGAYGLINSNNKLVNTTLLSSQAYIISGTIATVLKFLTGRTRPSYYPAGVEAEPRFLGPFQKSLHDANGSYENSSFPSGHATVAFAVASVFATQYKDKPVVALIAYSAASLIGISRITENKHWVTDVVTGAVLGCLTGNMVVKNYHRYRKLDSLQKRKSSISFSVTYSSGRWEPGAVYKFY